MGLFSFLNKNKQEAAGEDSGYFSRDEDSSTIRARSKRASSAGEAAAPRRERKSRTADDPVLPEKKRARRRLVGAIALALAVAVGLPMVLDSEPKPLASDIAFQIPSRDKAPPLPVPAAPGAAAVAASDSLDKREEIIEPPKADARAIKPVAIEPKSEPVAVKPEPKPVVKVEPKTEPKIEHKSEPKAVVAKVEPKPAEPKVVEPKPAAKPVEKAPKAQDSARALDILEGKAPAAGGDKFVVQVAALGTAEKVAELQDKLKAAGIRSFTHKVSTAGGERIQVKVGPFSREEADRMRGKLDKAGLSGSIVKPDGK